MSIERNLYLGHYVIFNIPPKKFEYVVAGCSKCNKERSSKFCQTCGTEISTIIRSKDENFSVYDIGDLFGSDWDDYLLGIDPMTGKRYYIGVINSSEYHLDIGDDITLDLSNFTVPQPEEELLELCDLIKEKYGPESLQIHYGLLQWFS